MKNNFTIFNQTNNERKQAQAILKFEINGKEYLIYNIANGDDNTKIILLSSICKYENNKYSISEITEEEKNSLGPIVHNIIMSLPFQNNGEGSILISNFEKENSIVLSLELPELSDEKYYSNSLIARVNSEVVEKTIDFYHIYLEKSATENVTSPSTWPIPGMQDAIPTPNNIETQAPIENGMVVNPEQLEVNMVNNNDMHPANDNSNVQNVIPINVIPDIMQNNSVDNVNNNQIQTGIENINSSNQQVEKLAIMRDSSTNNLNIQPNVMNPNNKGNAGTKYIVIGTVCIILALLVVGAAYIVINRIK